jgi:hypothetical protein
MTYIMVDVEADGPCPGLYSMVSLGAVVVEPSLNRTFYMQFKPISDQWIPQALAVSGHSRIECLEFMEPQIGMECFDGWLKTLNTKVYFISDNNGFDWQFVNYYFWKFLNKNPFGHSSTNLGSLYKGLERDMFKNFKHLRKTKHTHHPVADARGNAEAFLTIQKQFQLKTAKSK